MHHSIRFLFLLMLCGCQMVSGQVTMDEVVGIALKCHPQLNVARSEVAIAQARLIDAGKLDNPIFEFSLTSQLADGADRQGSIFMGYSQQFPVTEKLLRQRDLGIADIKLACAEIREVERGLIANVQKHYIEAVSAIANIEILRQFEEDTGEYVTLARNQFKIAQGSELDVAAADTERLLASQARELARCDYRQAIASLRGAMGVKVDAKLTLSQNLDKVTSALRNRVSLKVPEKICRPDIVTAEVKIQRAKAQQLLARSERLEDWEIAGGFEDSRSIDEPDGVERERFLSLGLRVPLPIRKKGQGRIAEAEAEIAKAEAELKLLTTTARAEVATNIEALCRSRDTITSIRTTLLPQLKGREKNTRQAYEQGLKSFNDVILLRQQQSRARETLIQAQREYALGLANLQNSLGNHPLLESYDPCGCPAYKTGTEPKSAPFALPVLRATPVENHQESFDKRSNTGKGLIHKFRNKR